jgi:hypothetical protein
MRIDPDANAYGYKDKKDVSHMGLHTFVWD